jgi:hypothetical protein
MRKIYNVSRNKNECNFKFSRRKQLVIMQMNFFANIWFQTGDGKSWGSASFILFKIVFRKYSYAQGVNFNKLLSPKFSLFWKQKYF